MPTVPTYNSLAMLTKARRAVWDAIDNWQPLIDWATNTGIVLLKHRLEDDLSDILSDGSSFFDLPSISVRPASVSEGWEVHRMAKFPDQMMIDVKTAYLDHAEELSEMIWQAVWQSAPTATPTVSYIKTATGRHPKTVGIQRNIGQVGQNKAWVFSLTINLEESQDVLSTILAARTAV
jgi:hypothetical protein